MTPPAATALPSDTSRLHTDLRLAIVIPTLDEGASLPATLERALAMADQVVVADGGSRDDTREIAARMGARVTISTAGRGIQLNAGARATDADIVLFLHADTRLPDDAHRFVRRAIAEGQVIGGGFRVQFDSRRRWLPLGARIMNLRTRLTGCPLGDQAQFVRRDAFDALGGFPDWPILEDLDFARRLKRHGRTVLIDAPVTTAARRFLNQGVTRTIATNWLIWSLYFVGVSPHRLARLYRAIR